MKAFALLFVLLTATGAAYAAGLTDGLQPGPLPLPVVPACLWRAHAAAAFNSAAAALARCLGAAAGLLTAAARFCRRAQGAAAGVTADRLTAAAIDKAQALRAAALARAHALRSCALRHIDGAACTAAVYLLAAANKALALQLWAQAHKAQGKR